MKDLEQISMANLLGGESPSEKEPSLVNFQNRVPEKSNRAGWLYIESLQSATSRSAHRSHLNWCVRTILEERGLSIEAALYTYNVHLPDDNKLTERDLFWLYDWSDLDGRLTSWLLAEKQSRPVLDRSNTETYASPNTLNAFRAALRGVARFAFELGLIDDRQIRQVNAVKKSRGSRLSRSVILDEDEIRSVMQMVKLDTTTRGKRDAAIFAVMLGAGLRRSEVGKVQVQEYRRARKNQTAYFYVVGKGNKEAEVHLPRWAAAYVEDWIDGYRGTEDPGPVFCRIRKDEQLQRDAGLSGEGVSWILKGRLDDLDLAELPRAHDLRRTFAERLNERTGDLLMVQEALRHSSIETTRLYLQKSSKRVAAAAAGDDADF